MEATTLKLFLESCPPGQKQYIEDPTTFISSILHIKGPQLSLHCSNTECQGIRFFVMTERVSIASTQINNRFLSFVCSNCRKSIKIFSVQLYKNDEDDYWSIRKYGEEPPFGPPVPSQAFKLIGGERDLFLKGRRCENQGMGIGSFVYYRRVIENQKIRIFEELIRVVSRVSSNQELIAELNAAKDETQFTKAVELIKHALPESLNINGHNPLTLLHSALSEGVHAHDDKECLELASSVRTVLFEFADRLSQALKNNAELNVAINKLAKKKLAK